MASILVGVVPFPSLPDDCAGSSEPLALQMARCVEECNELGCAGLDSVLLVNERSFPFPSNLTARDIAAATRMTLELRRSASHLRIGVDLVDDAEATFAVAAAAGCDFVRVRVAGPYVGLTNACRSEARFVRQLAQRSNGEFETWVSLLPWGERLVASWTLADLAAALVESIKPDRICVPLASSGEVVAAVGQSRVVFDGGVQAMDVVPDCGVYVLGSSLRQGSIENPLDKKSLSLLTSGQTSRGKSL